MTVSEKNKFKHDLFAVLAAIYCVVFNTLLMLFFTTGKGNDLSSL